MQALGRKNSNLSEPSGKARPRMEHRVKSWPEFFEAILSGAKTHEVRRMSDRDYQVGDSLRLMEFDPKTTKYTGRELSVRITFVTSADSPCALSDTCLHPDYCIISVVKY